MIDSGHFRGYTALEAAGLLVAFGAVAAGVSIAAGVIWALNRIAPPARGPR